MSTEPTPLASIPMATSPQEKFNEFLRTKGKRQTQERSQIVDEVFSCHDHFDADTLLERLNGRGMARKASRATIYRALELLEEAGLLRKVARTNGREVYEHAYGYPQHDHLICDDCGTLIEFPNVQVRAYLDQIAREHGFLLDSHRLEAFGICSNCAGPKKRPKKLQLL